MTHGSIIRRSKSHNKRLITQPPLNRNHLISFTAQRVVFTVLRSGLWPGQQWLLEAHIRPKQNWCSILPTEIKDFFWDANFSLSLVTPQFSWQRCHMPDCHLHTVQPNDVAINEAVFDDTLLNIRWMWAYNTGFINLVWKQKNKSFYFRYHVFLVKIGLKFLLEMALIFCPYFHQEHKQSLSIFHQS